MSNTTPPINPIDHKYPLPVTTAPNAPRRGTRLAFIVVPILIYLVVEHIPLPTVVVPTVSSHVKDSFELYNIASVGIIPWIIAAIMVEIIAMSIPGLRHLRHEGAIGRAQLQLAADILGSMVAFFHAGGIAITLINLHIGIYDPNHPEIGQPYATSPMLAFAALLAGAVFVRLLAEVVSRRGLVNGRGVIFFASLAVSILRTITRISHVPEWTDYLLLSTNVFIGSLALIWLIITKLQSARQSPGPPAA